MSVTATIWCDGAGKSAGGGPAGVGFVAVVTRDGWDDTQFEASLPIPNATNQMAEILAAAYALDQVDPCDHVTVWSDSEYVVKGWNEWMPAWVRRGWRTASGKPVKNRDHWMRLTRAVEKHGGRVEFKWCRGHDGTPGNVRADELAYAARMSAIERAEGMVL